MRRNKFGAVRTGGYHSRAEAYRAAELRALAAAGEITELREQVPLVVTPDGCHTRKLHVDFGYVENGVQVYEDTKSPATYTDVFSLKWVLAQWRYPDAVFRLSYQRRGGGFEIREEKRRVA